MRVSSRKQMLDKRRQKMLQRSTTNKEQLNDIIDPRVDPEEATSSTPMIMSLSLSVSLSLFCCCSYDNEINNYSRLESKAKVNSCVSKNTTGLTNCVALKQYKSIIQFPVPSACQVVCLSSCFTVCLCVSYLVCSSLFVHW